MEEKEIEPRVKNLEIRVAELAVKVANLIYLLKENGLRSE